MAQTVIRNLGDDMLDDHRWLARDKGASVEAELRQLIEANRPLRKNPASELLQLSDEALAMTPPDRPMAATALWAFAGTATPAKADRRTTMTAVDSGRRSLISCCYHGSMLVRQLDDAKLARLKARAKAERTSTEALAREAIHQAAGGMTGEEKVALAREWQKKAERAKIPGAPQTPSWVLMREDRDSGH